MCASKKLGNPSDEERLLTYATLEHLPFSSLKEPFEPLPASSGSTKVTALHCGTLQIPAYQICHQAQGDMVLPCFSFLVEHQSNEKVMRCLFDLGPRKPGNLADWHSTVRKYNNTSNARSTTERLADLGLVASRDINSIILSHTHWDHVGDLSEFPSHVQLVLGPDTENDTFEKLAQELDVPLESLNQRSIQVLESNSPQWRKVGSMQGIDFFGDGSFWLLSSPGHKRGHLAALAKVSSASNGKWILLGGDSCHHHEMLSTAQDQVASSKPKIGYWPPFAEVPVPCYHADPVESYRSIARIERMEEEENVLAFLAHDTAYLNLIEADKLEILDDGEQFEELKRNAKQIKVGSRLYK